MRSAVIFLEASIEPVPPSLWKHPVIVANAKRRGKSPERILLDDSKHHYAMKYLEDREKRGRPDIVHQCLLLLLDSKMGREVDVFVHTIRGEIIRIDPETRLPRNLNRFIGLMEDLFVKTRIEAEGKTLVELTELSLRDVVAGRRVLLLREGGRKDDLGKLLDEGVAICIGAFPHGDFSQDTLNALHPYRVVSFGPEPHTSLYVTAKVVCEYERIRFAEDC